MKTRQVVICALLGAILYALQVAMAGLPNIEPVTLLLILYTLYFPNFVPYILALFIALEGFTHGFGIWWINYLYVWPMLVFLAWFCRKNTSAVLWAILAGSFGLCFGALCAIPWAITGGLSAGFAYWVSGIPFDILHCIGNFVLMLLLYKPLSVFFKRLAYQLQTQPCPK